MQTQILERLFTRKEFDLAARKKFDRAAGRRYGLGFGIVLVLTGWGLDCWELAFASTELAAVKIFLACLTLVPLSVITAALAARVTRWRRISLWIITGALTGLIALQLPFEGMSFIAALFDPYARGARMFPPVSTTLEMTLPLALFGVIGGACVGALQNFAMALAWDCSDATNRLTFSGGLMLLVLTAPFALTLGALYDGAANAEQRISLRLTERVIRTAFDLPPDLDLSNPRISTQSAMDYAASTLWRANFSRRYVQSISDYAPTSFRDVFVDVVFDNGFIWRCQSLHYGTSLSQCQDLRKTYTDLVRQFLRDGAAQCENCAIRIEPDALAQRAKIAGSEPRQITLTHHTGRVVSARIETATGAIELTLTGANPIILR
ncbi:MAG: hypothetical protein HZC40_11430 [Chloroflexi bacterium]|nr:hypothetical protein [Chloroflexota bacterium]